MSFIYQIAYLKVCTHSFIKFKHMKWYQTYNSFLNLWEDCHRLKTTKFLDANFHFSFQ